MFANACYVKWHWSGTRWFIYIACWNLKTNEKDKVRFLVVGEDLTPDCLALTTQKMNQLTVHKENFINVVGNANDDLTGTVSR